MIQIKCSNCNRKKFRIQSTDKPMMECRACYKRLYGASRPISSRMKIKRVNMKRAKVVIVNKKRKSNESNIVESSN